MCPLEERGAAEGCCDIVVEVCERLEVRGGARLIEFRERWVWPWEEPSSEMPSSSSPLFRSFRRSIERAADDLDFDRLCELQHSINK